MGQVSRCLRRTTDGYSFWCPGCREMHHVWTDRAERPCWTFDGNVDSPTFTPSLLITGKQIEQDAQGRWTGEWVKGPDGAALDHVCHSFVTNGRLLFLADCTHALAGKTIDLPDLPPWAADDTREEAPMSDTDQNAPAPGAVDETTQAPAADVTQADAPPPETPPQAETPPEAPADAAQQAEPPATPLESPENGNSGAQDGAEPAEQAAPGKTDTILMHLDAESMAKLSADLSAQITAGFAAAEQVAAERAAEMRREFEQELTEFAGHFEKKLDSIAEGLDGLDPDKLTELLAAIKESGTADLKARLDKLELQLRHTL